MFSARTTNDQTPRLAANGPHDPAATLMLPQNRVRLSLGTVARLVDMLFDWQQRRRQRQHLARLDHYMLRDIGLSPADVDGETQKPFWRP
jgi:uncharacterized protein YjiS (DUF1127 family)